MTVPGAEAGDGRGGRTGGNAGGGGGIPDGLLLGLLGFLLALTVLVWGATGLSGLLAHGSWPPGIDFAHTPPAIRHLAADPRDLAGAWPEAEGQLSGYGLFWGLFIGELMVLTVLTVFVLGVVARLREMRRTRRAAGKPARPSGRDTTSGDIRPREAAAQGFHGSRAAQGRTPDQGGSPAFVPADGSGVRPADGLAGPGGAAPPPVHDMGVPGPAGDHEAAASHRPAGAAAEPTVGATAGSAIGAAEAAGRTDPGADSAVGSIGPAGSVGSARTARPAHTAGPAGSPLTTGPYAAGAPQQGGSPPVFTKAAQAAPAGGPVPGPPDAQAGAAPDTPYGEHGGPGTGGPRWGVHFTGPGGVRARRPLALRTVEEAAGPLLVVTSDPGLWEESKDGRAKLGPVHLHDPGHLLDTPARLRWSPTAGCESRDVAAARAAALLAPVRPLHALHSAMADAAETMLRCWLHAAAIDDRRVRQVHRWASGSSAHEPVRILRTNPRAAGGSAGELESVLTAHPERREMAQALTARALSTLSSVHIRDACNPTRADSLALESFMVEGGTLYLVGESIEDPRAHPGAMPFLTALASSVVEHGRRVAERSSAGRLDPPLTVVLDDVAAVAPFPQLPELLASGAARGMPTLALLRSREQARFRWPQQALPTG